MKKRRRQPPGKREGESLRLLLEGAKEGRVGYNYHRSLGICSQRSEFGRARGIPQTQGKEERKEVINQGGEHESKGG